MITNYLINKPSENTKGASMRRNWSVIIANILEQKTLFTVTGKDIMKAKCIIVPTVITRQLLDVTSITTQTKHEGRSYSCNICSTTLSTPVGLYNHKKSKHEEIKHDCPKCDYKATLKGNLKIHIQAMHEGLDYLCGQCNYKASTPRSLRLHKNSKHVITV